jgi:hypothetical protein
MTDILLRKQEPRNSSFSALFLPKTCCMQKALASAKGLRNGAGVGDKKVWLNSAALCPVLLGIGGALLAFL